MQQNSGFHFYENFKQLKLKVNHKEHCMEALQPCPNCLRDVEVVMVNRALKQRPHSFFFVHCNHCGHGTQKAYHSKTALIAIWNSLVSESYY